MTFTFPILTLCIGGAQRMLVEIINGLVARRHNVLVLMPPQGAVEYPLHAPVIRTRQDYGISEEDYPASDVIVSNYYLLVPTAEAASQKGKGVHVRFSLCYEPSFLPDNHITFPSYHVTQNLIALSKWQQQIIRLNHGIEGYIVPVGVSPSFQNLHIRETQERLQVSAIARGTDGGFSWHRDQDYLFRQLERVKRNHPEVDVNLFCPPNEFKHSSRLQRLKASGFFRVYTPADDREMIYHYNQADIFVSSSTYDSASLPGLEAMRCGAALVTTYSGGNADYCRPEENCLLSYRYQSRLAEDVIRLIQSPELRTKLAGNGETEAAKWSWENSLDKFEGAIEQILHRGSSGVR